MLHHPVPSRPTTPMREPTRSELLLRDALRRDDARTPPSRTPAKSSPRLVRRSTSPPAPGEPSEKRRYVSAYGGDSEFLAMVTRDRSPSPTPHSRRRHSHSRSSFTCRTSSPCRMEHAQATPHELVLRARLEGVLTAARSIQDRLERIRSPAPISTSPSASNSTESVDRGSNGMQVPPTPSTSSSVFITAPFLSRIRSPQTSSLNGTDEADSEQDEKSENQMLTPPPTPPLMHSFVQQTDSSAMHSSSSQRKPSKRQRSDPLPESSRILSPPPTRSPSSPHLQEYGELSPTSPMQPRFNARTASAQCRDMPGYVSFASIEGLGAPANLDGEDDDHPDGGRSENRSGGLWSFLGRRKN